MKVLITGCAGRVGEAVTEHLLARGFSLRGIDMVDEVAADIDYRKCDMLDPAALKPHVEGVEAVLHLAAIAAVGRGMNADIFKVNAAGTFNVFDACAESGISRVVAASSINAIGYFFGSVPFELDYLPVDEDHPKLTSDSYSFSKQVTEDIGRYFWRRDGISNTCLRFGAGLRPIEEMKETQAGPLAEARTVAEELLSLPKTEQASEVTRIREAYDEGRRARMYEQRGSWESDLTGAESRLMSQRQNYYSFVALEDACVGMELSLTADYEGSHPLLILDGNNTLMMDTLSLVDLVYPDVAVRGTLSGTQSIASPRKAKDLIGFETRIPASELFV